MKLAFSEYKPLHDKYVYPYAIWAFPEEGEKPADLYAKGFLPSAKDLSRYYMTRSVRVDLKQFKISSENKRILKKIEHVDFKLIKRKDFDFDKKWKKFCLDYAENRWGERVMPPGRLKELFEKEITSDVLVFTDQESKKDIGLITVFNDENKIAHYYYAFYDLSYFNNNLGMFMMTQTVKLLAENGFDYLYLGTCYSRNSMYKKQFSGVEFWNGFKWTQNMKELKYLISRDQQEDIDIHLLESGYIEQFYEKGISDIIS